MRIEVLTFDRSQLLDVTGPLQVFASANDHEWLKGRPAPYDPVVVSPPGGEITSSGLAIGAKPLPDPAMPLDTLIVAGGWGVSDACKDEGLLDWIRQRASAARRTASVCSGAFLLASAGLLDGRKAVTHWQRCDEFRQRFPAVKLMPDPIFIEDRGIWTAAGVTAGIDLALAMVEADLGRSLALAVARQLVVFLKRPGGQSQFSTALTLQDNSQNNSRTGAGRFDALHGWIMENLARPLTLEDMAEQAGMSSRSFSRHYLSATGRTPARALEHLRMENARRLLEQGAPVSQTARRCGFGTEETMRRSFQRHLGISPQDYRQRFCASA